MCGGALHSPAKQQARRPCFAAGTSIPSGALERPAKRGSEGRAGRPAEPVDEAPVRFSRSAQNGRRAHADDRIRAKHSSAGRGAGHCLVAEAAVHSEGRSAHESSRRRDASALKGSPSRASSARDQPNPATRIVSIKAVVSTCRSGARLRIGRYARVLGRRRTFDRIDTRRLDRPAWPLKRVQATFALLLDKSLDVLFAPTLPALHPIAQVAVPARHLLMTLISPRREFIAENHGICSVPVRDLSARCGLVLADPLGRPRMRAGRGAPFSS